VAPPVIDPDPIPPASPKLLNPDAAPQPRLIALPQLVAVPVCGVPAGFTVAPKCRLDVPAALSETFPDPIPAR
jgi:hypothetical protein